MRGLKLGIVVAIAAIVVVGITVGVINRQPTKPYNEVRKAVASIKPIDIAAVKIEMLPEAVILWTIEKPDVEQRKRWKEIEGYPYKVKKDPVAIPLMLKGLKEASRPDPVRLNRTHKVTIMLNDWTVIGPFDFGSYRQDDCFSPLFVDGLKKAGFRIHTK